jgi:hypothetical protein
VTDSLSLWERFKLCLLSAGARWLRSSFIALAADILRPGRQCILVKADPEGYAASAIPAPSRKRSLSVQWNDAGNRWMPEADSRQILDLAKERPVDLELPPGMVLSNTVRLPKAALANLSEAVAYGLPSWSPFQAVDVYVSANLKEVQGEQALVRICYAVRTKVDPILTRLADLDLAVDRLRMDPFGNGSVDLRTLKTARIRRGCRVDFALALCAVALSLLVGVGHVTALSRRLDEAEAVLRQEVAQFRETEAIQGSYALFLARHTAVSDRRANEVGAYELLSAFARHMPEGALIQTLDVGNGRVRLEVSTPDPTALTAALRIIPFVREPKVEPMRGLSTTVLSFDLARRTP